MRLPAGQEQVDPHRLISGLKLLKVTAEVVLHDIYQLGSLPSEALNAAVSLSSFPVEAAVISTAAAELASSPKIVFMYSACWAVPSQFLKTGLHFFQNGKYWSGIPLTV